MLSLFKILSEIKILPKITSEMVWQLLDETLIKLNSSGTSNLWKKYHDITKKYNLSNVSQLIKFRDGRYNLSQDQLNKLY
ncbi:MAG TPA: hypothetical protein VFV86_09475, partial [Nitrososphaeraceae archaeon]|nr:hypothetical protein [Nitrososphaeraceae archaeon]